MKQLESVAFSRQAFQSEMLDFRKLLDDQAELAERRDILAFFRDHRQVASAVGFANQLTGGFDRVAIEFPLFGEYVCDLVVGDSRKGQFCFVEFEDAMPESVFKRKGRGRSDWSDRLNRGFSQIIDWFMVLDDQRRTGLHKARFGADEIQYNGLLAIGRDAHLDLAQRRRLNWRSQNVLVHGKRVYCQTFDELYTSLAVALEFVGGP